MTTKKKVSYTVKKRRLRDKCDALWQEKIKKIHGELCEVCGSDYRVAGHHWYRKGSYGFMRYYLKNGVRLCYSCHRMIHDGSTKIRDAIEDLRGKEWKEALKEKSRNRPENFSTTLKYYQEVYNKLKG